MAITHETQTQEDELSPFAEQLEEAFSPGELAPAEGNAPLYGYANERLPDKYQNVWRRLAQKIAQENMYARIEQVIRAARQRFYWRSLFDVTFSSQNMTWEMPQQNQAEGDADTSDIAISYPINIYTPKGREFITQVGVIPEVKFKPGEEAMSPERIASDANAMRAKIEWQNHAETLAQEVARLFYTDGPVGFYSRYVTDGARFGYQDGQHNDEEPEGLGKGGDPPPKQPRDAKGGAVMTPYGVLELKLPISLRDISQFPWLQLSYEIALSSGKAMYPHAAERLTAGNPGPGEYNFDRTTRIACTQGVRMLVQSGDVDQQLPTIQRIWARSSYFTEIDSDEDRQFFYENYPDGGMVVFIGDVYCESRNESMDDHWDIAYPVQGDGQTTPSAGHDMIAVQDALNDAMDLWMSMNMRAIPAMYGDKNVFDFEAYSKQRAGYGAKYPLKESAPRDGPVADHVFMEPAVDVPASFPGLFNMLLTTIPQGITGLFPAAIGDADPNNETKGGILALRDASLGQQGVAWKAFRTAYARAMQKCIACESYYLQAEAEDGMVRIASPGVLEQEVDLENLRTGAFVCVAEDSSSRPATEAEKQQQFQSLVTAAINGFAPAVAILSEPKNANIFKSMLNIPGLVIPGAAETEKQMSEIRELLQGAPIPQPAAMIYIVAAALAQKTGKPAPQQPPPTQMARPTVAIDENFDNHAVEFQAGKDWMNSSEGQLAKKENPQGFANVTLHLLLHQEAMQQAQQTQMKTQAQMALMMEAAKHPPQKGKTPAESINFKDLGPSGKLQAGKQAGLDLIADVAADLVGESLPGGEKGQE